MHNKSSNDELNEYPLSIGSRENTQINNNTDKSPLSPFLLNMQPFPIPTFFLIISSSSIHSDLTINGEEPLTSSIISEKFNETLLSAEKQILRDMSLYERWLFKNKEAYDSVQKGLKDAALGKLIKIDINKL